MNAINGKMAGKLAEQPEMADSTWYPLILNFTHATGLYGSCTGMPVSDIDHINGQ